MLRPSPNHGTQRLPNDDDDDGLRYAGSWVNVCSFVLLFGRYVCYPEPGLTQVTSSRVSSFTKLSSREGDIITQWCLEMAKLLDVTATPATQTGNTSERERERE